MIKNYSFQKNEFIVIKEKGKVSQVALSEVSHIETKSGLSIINKINNEKIFISKNLKSLEIECNLKNKALIRINRNEIINFAYIKEVSFINKNLTLFNGRKFTITRRNIKNIKELFIQKK